MLSKIEHGTVLSQFISSYHLVLDQWHIVCVGVLTDNSNVILFNVFRCQAEFENRDEAAKGDEATQKQFHAFVLFLGELYLNLEVGRKLFFTWFFINFCCV